MPKLKLSSRTLRAYLSLGGLITIVMIAYYWYLQKPLADVISPPPVPVHVTEVQQRDVPIMIPAIGNVRSLHSVEIRSQVDGILLEILVNEGQLVKEGDLLARIDDRAIVAALEQAKAQQTVAQAQLTAANVDLQRYRALGEIQAISGQTLDQQIALVAQLRATVQSQQSSVLANQVQLSYTRIYSPVTGRVGIRNVHQGSYVQANNAQALFSVIQLDPISIEAYLPQARLAQLQSLASQLEQLRTPILAYSNHEGALLSEGYLTLIDNRITDTTGTLRIKGNFANSQGRLWPDQSVVVKVQAETLLNALVVPQRALRQGVKGSFVWLIKEGKALPYPVQVTYSDAEIAVVEGIQAGDTVISDGYSRLRPQIQIRIVETSDSGLPPVAKGGA
ncbi:RND family efflux transporter MFP subunit [Pseudomonas fluorescens]|uniref:RND family efflux transporter MFP subunit n=1 Tax=Pseudomonas fluorescens TaxID=294 RepID=A0A379ICZ1_PSEFL|nr:efflux RND transporter periplasmic adaptor subunit [Pseudomonas fluorescens]AIG01649.1 RND family multidrug transporter membrane fusion protein [Pseudomonas fluorescens]SUD30727.1 RND family efflux transporter MFP subunit [Pseudomonas fluorescens]